MAKNIKNYFLEWLYYPIEIRAVLIMAFLGCMSAGTMSILITKLEGLYFTLTTISVIVIIYNVFSLFNKYFINKLKYITIMRMLSIITVIDIITMLCISFNKEYVVIGLYLLASTGVLLPLLIDALNANVLEYINITNCVNIKEYSANKSLIFTVSSLIGTLLVVVISIDFSNISLITSNIKYFTSRDWLAFYLCIVMFIVFAIYRLYYTYKYAKVISNITDKNK